MTPAARHFLALLAAALQGKRLALELPEEEWREIFSQAHAQKLLPYVLEAATRAPEGEDPDFFAPYRQLARQQVVAQACREIDFAELYRRLREQGLHPLVVKGRLCSRLYPMAAHRISIDDDLLLPAGELEACHLALTRQGLRPQFRPEELTISDELTYRDERLYIELHLALFETGLPPEQDWNRLFSDVHKAPAQADGLLTLPPQTHLLYLILHACKHFAASGVGIRQTCDIALWARHYGSRIDWDGLLADLDSVRAGGFAAAQMTLAERYLGLELPIPGSWRQRAADPEAMLNDMLDGGVYGSASLARLHSGTVTRNALRGEKGEAGILGSVFPKREELSGRYPYLRKHPALLPVAWVSRLTRYAGELTRSKDGGAAESVRLGRERVELLRRYGLMDEK